LNVGFDRTAPHSSALDVQSIHMNTARLYRFLLFQFLAQEGGLDPRAESQAQPSPACDLGNQIRRWLKYPRGCRRCANRAAQTTSQGAFIEILAGGLQFDEE